LAVGYLFMPQLPLNDWFRNASDLASGLRLYDNPSYVYPPWALILLFPYYVMGEAVSRALSILIITYYGHTHRWPIWRLVLICLAPACVWTLVLSSADILILLGAVVLWQQTPPRRWVSSGMRGLGIALLLLKPQVGLLLALYFLASLLRNKGALLRVLLVTAAITLPVSLLPDPSGQPLVVAWLNNIAVPSTENSGFWQSNNLSLSSRIGPFAAFAIVGASLSTLYFVLQRRGGWSREHSIASCLLVSMLMMPYSSNQSVIVLFVLLPAAPAVILNGAAMLTAAVLNLYAVSDEWFTLGSVLLAMFLWHRQRAGQNKDATVSARTVQTSIT
jgi:hypothetical protein